MRPSSPNCPTRETPEDSQQLPSLVRTLAVHCKKGLSCRRLCGRSGFDFRRRAAFSRRWRLDDAIATYRQRVALALTFPHTRYHLGLDLGDAEQYDEVAWLEQAVTAEPERAEASNSLGYCYSRLGQPALAMAYHEWGTALRPDYAQAHVNLDLTLLRLEGYLRGLAR
jgi:hypothetical protein